MTQKPTARTVAPCGIEHAASCSQVWGSRVPRLITALVLATVLLAISAGSASAASPPGFVGMTADDLYWNAGPYRDQALDQQRAAGVKLLRVTFSWATMEYEPGRFDYTNQDKYVLDAARHGIGMMAVLFDPPDWRERKPGRNESPPTSNDEMAAWAAALVDRYGPNGSIWRSNPTVTPQPITVWQIWNEPTLPQYWAGRPNIKQYVRMLRSVGGAIKGRDRGAEVVTAGLPDSRLRGAIRLAPFLKGLYKGGGTSAFDTVAINTYAVNARYMGKLMNSTRALMNRSGGRSDGTWITELGWCDKGAKSRFCAGTEGQAKNIAASLKIIKQKRRAWKLHGFVLFSWRDGRPYGTGNQWGLHTGLLNLKGKKKPAYNAFVHGVKSL